VFVWKKRGKVFTPQAVEGRSWLKEFAQAPATLVFDDFVRVYFSCRPPADANGQYVSYSAYVDLDRGDLFKVLRVSDAPILALGGLGEFDEFGTYPVSVIRAGDEVRAYYAGWTRCESVPFDVAIGCAVSHDQGKTFTRLGRGPVLGRSPDEPMFPLDAFAVHSVPFVVLVNWFEEILGGQVIDETGLPGIYGFELKERVNTPDAFMQPLRDEAGLVIARQRREAPTLIVRQRSA